jgi:hypothetical protein
VTLSFSGIAPERWIVSLSPNRAVAIASRICVNRSPEFSEMMSQLSVG